MNTEGIWQNLLKQHLDMYKIINFGLEYLNLVISKQSNKFWKDVLIAWREVRKKESVNLEKLTLTPLWYNNDIKIGNNYVSYKHWQEKNIFYINDIIKPDGNFLDYDDLKNEFDLKTNILEANGLIRSIKAYLKKLKETKSEKIYGPSIPPSIEIIIKSKKGAKYIYRHLKNKKIIINSQSKWSRIFNELDLPQFKEFYQSIYTIKESKLQSFQFRINHFILTTNKSAFKINLCDSPLCTFCNEHEEDIVHLLWSCAMVQTLLAEVTEFFNSFSLTLNVNKKYFLLGPYNENDLAETIIILHIKHFIYRCKCQKLRLSFNSLLPSLKNMFLVYKQIYKEKNKLQKFDKIWSKWKPVLEN